MLLNRQAGRHKDSLLLGFFLKLFSYIWLYIISEFYMCGEQGSNVHLDVVLLEESTLQQCSQINDNPNKDSILVHLDISFKSPSHT